MFTVRLRNAPPFLLLSILLFSCVGALSAQENCVSDQIFTSKACKGDSLSAEEQALFEAVNKYRASNGLPPLKLSAALSLLGNRRMLDLNRNQRVLTHSWSNCPYDMKQENTWTCMIDSPRRLNSGYNGQGYETLYRTSTGRVQPDAAISSWSKSALHSSILLNRGMFADLKWEEIGVAVDGRYAALWFGFPGKKTVAPVAKAAGIGASYDQAVAGLAKLLSITQISAATGRSLWVGYSADRRVKLEVTGDKNDIASAEVSITLVSGPAFGTDATGREVLARLLQNMFPEWPDINTWLDNGLRILSQNSTAWRTKVVRGSLIELKGAEAGGLKLTVKPQGKASALEVF